MYKISKLRPIDEGSEYDIFYAKALAQTVLEKALLVFGKVPSWWALFDGHIRIDDEKFQKLVREIESDITVPPEAAQVWFLFRRGGPIDPVPFIGAQYFGGFEHPDNGELRLLVIGDV